MSDTIASKIALETMGCKLNQAESERLAHKLSAAGWQVVSANTPADIYILNTCTVTHVADRKARQFLRAAVKRHPGARVIAVGCYAEHAAAELAAIPGVSLVLGHTAKENLAEMLGRPAIAAPPRSNTVRRTRAFIKVQSGCRHGCAYCIVPRVRGPETSISPDEILSEAEERFKAGYQEIVLTGTRVGTYHQGDTGLKELLTLILRKTAAPRLRLSSLQPREITPELIRLWPENARLCRHFHLALQSGSPAVLERMRRDYTIAEYEAAIELIRSLVPGAAITTDIIAGFPGETEADFQESYERCRRLGFARIHVFPYSPRPGTIAAGFTGQLDSQALKERAERLRRLAARSSREFARRFLGQVLPVLYEQREPDGAWSGLTDNYIRVFADGPEGIANTIRDTRLGGPSGEGLRGEIIP